MTRIKERHCGKAVAASGGVVIGRVQKLMYGRHPIPEYDLREDQIRDEIRRLDSATALALAELDEERRHVEKMQSQDPLLILDAHRMLMLDPELIEKAKDLVREQAINAEWALRRRMDAIEAVFDSIEDDYLRGKKSDVEQVGERIIRQLMGVSIRELRHAGDEPQIMIGEDFSPPDVVALWRQGVAGLVADQGGVNAHNIIVARGVGMPALIGTTGIFEYAEDGDTLILDGEQGIWILNPDEAEQEKYRQFAEAMSAVYSGLRAFADKPSQSSDGHAIKLMANIEFADELDVAREVGADGVGLFRTEFLFLGADSLPDEDQQFEQYACVVREMEGKPVTLRLLDIGGDKPGLFQQLTGHPYSGENPAMGLRGIRLLLQWPELLQTQIRAMLRAAEEGPVQILVPMVTGCEEIHHVRDVIERCRAELGISAQPLVGAMIEVPAAAMVADDLARCCDMFSIGTNDLIQYTLAADRGDEDVGNIYHAEHPAVWQMIRQTVRAAKKHGIPVSVCGEMASDPAWTQAFLNLGMDALSMSINKILPIRKHLSQIRFEPEQ
ncbi:MAG: phosphoenolpyruvate--protein phosphotransferase [Mariprofundaceae bacterium]|nr:phosphoenolpyruvate--protein phosphotransferase [Mariprofundaceae bacterium]